MSINLSIQFIVYLLLFAVSYLSQLDRKSESQPAAGYMNPRVQGSPVKSQLMSRLEDYNDSGYGGSPLPPGIFYQLNQNFFLPN